VKSTDHGGDLVLVELQNCNIRISLITWSPLLQHVDFFDGDARASAGPVFARGVVDVGTSPLLWASTG